MVSCAPGAHAGGTDRVTATAVIAIDGPSGSGKSTVAECVAQRLNLSWLSSGALYRALTRLALDRFGGIGPPGGLLDLMRDTHWTVSGATVYAADLDLTATLHSSEVDSLVAPVSAIPAVRTAVNRTLRARVAGGRWVVEGRDMGTEVFPDAVVKVFLDAAPDVRARRRAQQRGSAGRLAGRIAADLAERDRRDRRKPVGALRPAADAQFIETSHLTATQVCDKIVAVIPTNFPPE